ncbi:Ribonuclease 3 [Pararobbsia alpina]|uniref:Ribonuclease 3 n=1 Tax=Pararobbsia alpina TaxID=621374 RepID=A0A6S7B681_9BURK|nr:Ribonuclease 3 [Pararobbsia alpina]
MRYEFRNAELLRQAMTHRSHSATHNERLEFLGDSVLNCVVASLLFERFSKLDEGDLSRVRANLVKQQSLYELAQGLGIAEFLRLGEGELKSGGFRRPSILADTLEAILGAVFLDSGFDAAQTVIRRLYSPILDHIDPRTLGKDAKTLLQEHLQGHKIALPQYTVIATHGAAHNQQFEVECLVPKLDIKVFGSGASRRAAEQAAAKKALDEMQTLAPSLTAKSKRSKSARAAAKQAEADAAIQQALDLRAPPSRPPRAERAHHAEKTVEKGLEKPVSDKAVSDRAVPEKSVPEKAASNKPVSDKAVSDKATAEKAAVDKPPTEKPTADKPTADKPTLVQSSVGKAPAVHPPPDKASLPAPVAVIHGALDTVKNESGKALPPADSTSSKASLAAEPATPETLATEAGRHPAGRAGA